MSNHFGLFPYLHNKTLFFKKKKKKNMEQKHFVAPAQGGQKTTVLYLQDTDKRNTCTNGGGETKDWDFPQEENERT